MDSTVIVSLISLLGTLVGSLGGIVVSGKLTAYRIQQLENKVAEHNNFARRMPVVEEQIKVINHRIEDLEQEEKFLKIRKRVREVLLRLIPNEIKIGGCNYA